MDGTGEGGADGRGPTQAATTIDRAATTVRTVKQGRKDIGMQYRIGQTDAAT